jgi:hypothetical protein
MSRGRPRGSVKPDRRQRRDYRFSPATMQKIEQGRQITSKTETAFVEDAIQHYHEFLLGGDEASEVERLRAHIQLLEGELAEASRPSHSRPVPVIEHQPPAPVAATSSSRMRQPVYQIYMRHEPGPCPDLPEGFDYIDGDSDKDLKKRRCTIPHRVFAQPCKIEAARRRVEQLQGVANITRVWVEDGKGKPLSRDSWRRENGRWVRED